MHMHDMENKCVILAVTIVIARACWSSDSAGATQLCVLQGYAAHLALNTVSPNCSSDRE
jgi:hypothetical protein